MVIEAGVDTVTLSFPIHSHSLEHLPEAETIIKLKHRKGQMNTSANAILPSGMKVRSQGDEVSGLRLIITGSLPKVLRGNNIQPVAPDEAIALIRDVVVPQVAEISTGAQLSSARFSRLDTAIDLACPQTHLPQVLRAYETVPVRRGTRRSLERSQGNSSETLWTKNTQRELRLYNSSLHKSVYYPSLEPAKDEQAILRVEAQNRIRDLAKAGLRRYADFEREPHKVTEIHQETVRWAGMHREVLSIHPFVARFNEYSDANGFSEAKRTRLLGCYVSEAAGHPPRLARQAMAEYRRISRKLAIHLNGNPLPRSEVSYRLDFDRRRVIYEVFSASGRTL